MTGMKLVAVIVALAFLMSASPRAAMAADVPIPAAPSAGPNIAAAPGNAAARSVRTAKTGRDAKVFEILKKETQFSMFYEALVNTTEIWNVEGRTVLDGEQLILFAPTNTALINGLPEDVMPCLQKEPGQATLASFLEDLQVVVPINASFPQVNTTKQLLNLTKDGCLWTIGGRGIVVTEDADGSIRLTSDDGVDSVTVQEARATDPTVTLFPLENTVIVEEEVGNNITRMCLGGQVSESSAAPPSTDSLRRVPGSESSSKGAGGEHVSESSTAAPSSGALPYSAPSTAAPSTAVVNCCTGNLPPRFVKLCKRIMAAAEEMERKFAASFLEGEDYSKERDSSELARVKAELAALQNKFENMGFVSVRITWTKDEEHREWFEYLELIVQAWRTDVEGDLLGFLFGSVHPNHRQLIALELTVPLAQLADDLPLEIVSQSDESPVPHVLTRTLTAYLQWSACLEEPGTSRNLPSQQDYLDPREIIDLTFFQDRAASEDEEIEIKEESVEEEEEATEEDAEETTPEEGSYSEHSEGDQSEGEEEDEEEEEELELEETEWEISAEELERTKAEQAEDPEAVRKRDEIAAEKRQLEFASVANLPITDDLARDPEPPKPEDGEQAETSSSPTGRRRSRSPSPSTSDQPSVQARTNTGHRASSTVVIPQSP
ncbi:hypothetical protein CBR_g45934 [Chara braunii]|uniref:FAS1 domain-containing protein n=1 Tax=Chara braunii TaxID=69332 RepID=A0A388LZM9_CHABU|nr:hypothetical protein CBR_g45934 [Chara braunii]|eukprot:GBG87778.1 hypothetical protein CBR_g45934 [Chara braunii]